MQTRSRGDELKLEHVLLMRRCSAVQAELEGLWSLP